MAERRRVKWCAIALGSIEFLFGLGIALMVAVQQSWISANPAVDLPRWWWPVIGIFSISVIFGPPTVAYLAERTQNDKVLFVCLGVLVAYPAIFVALAI